VKKFKCEKDVGTFGILIVSKNILIRHISWKTTFKKQYRKFCKCVYSLTDNILKI